MIRSGFFVLYRFLLIDSILEEINPAFKQTKDQDRKIKNLEEKVDRMGSSFDELKELLIKKLG